jgi:hypothetical protein
VTDMRRGFDGLSAQVQTVLNEQPFSGHVFVFRGRRGDIVKLLATAFVCLPSVWSEDDSSGRRLPKEQFVCLVRSCRCSWKASTGAGRRGLGRHRSQCELQA